MRTRAMLVATCAVLACSGGDVTDAASRDTGSDAGQDADSRDAGQLDAAPDSADVSIDAPLARNDPGWVRLPGYPDECYVERARQPSAVLAYHWEPCLDSLPACQMAIVDRSAAPLDFVGGLGGGNDGRGIITWHLIEPDQHHDLIASSRDDVVVVAWRAGYRVAGFSCGPILAASAAGVGVDGGYIRSDGTGADRVSVAPWTNLTSLDSSVWTSTMDIIAVGDFLETPSTSATTFAGTLTTGRILAVEPPVAAILGNGDLNPVVVGHTVLWNWGDATGTTAIHLSHIGGIETELYRAPAGTALVGIRADGTWITWRAGPRAPFSELWAAPYREIGPLAPRRLWTDAGNGGYNGTIGDGMFAYAGSDTTGTTGAIKVVDLATGSRRQYVLPLHAANGDGWYLTTDPAWVTRDEVASPIHRAVGGAIVRTVVRIDLRGLPVEPLP